MNYFDDPNSKHFSFQSFADGLDENTFGVINFKGFEAISKTYDFEIMLVSSNKEIDLEDLLQAQAVFTIHRGDDDDVLYNGILAEFDQLHEVNDVIFYRARLVPKLWWLTLTHHNQVFLDQSVPDLVEDALRDGGLESEDFDIGALSDYEENSYICQYDESHFNFVSRCLERQGIYYYFVQEDDGEVLTLTDTKFSHDALKEGSDLFYNPASGLEGKHLGEAIGSFTCRQKQLPAEIILKDYNYERPSLDITSHAEVDPVGRGLSYLYGEYFATPEEGERLAGIRAEELLCKKQEFFGESTVPYIMPGFTFNLNNHYREDFNQEYLILEVTHEGNQSHLMSGGITTDSDKSQNHAIYHNSFKAIPNETQYRPDRITEKPKISGTIHAKIDSEVDGEYAQIDEQGRYKVYLPFDINDEHMDGKGSAPIRMMQSYAGKNRGMQLPLIKGTEILLTFIEGNPDRPVIAGAVSNPETQGPVNADNQSESVIQTGSNNKIRMEDKFGSERVMLESPMANSWLRIGATNDPIILKGDSPLYLPNDGKKFKDPGAYSHDPSDEKKKNTDPIDATIIKDASGADKDANGTAITVDTTSEGQYFLTYVDTKKTTNTATRQVIIYDQNNTENADLQGSISDGIRIRSAGNLWLEARSRYGEYHTGKPTIGPTNETDTDPSQIGDLLANFGSGYKPKNLKKHKSQTSHCTDPATAGESGDDSFANAIAQGHVRVSSLDTFNTQEGNIYDFGGYWNYDLGNSYTEAHINQQAELNTRCHVGWAGTDFTTHGSNTGEAFGYISTVIMPAATLAIVIPNSTSIGGGIYAGMMTGFVATLAAYTATHIIAETTNIMSPNDWEGIGDVIDGPQHTDTASKEIHTWADKVGTSFDGTKQTTASLSKKRDQYAGNRFALFGPAMDKNDNLTGQSGRMSKDTTWMEKKFGDSYTFTRGNSIEITHGNSEEHVKGDQYEYKYGGVRESTSFTGKGIKTAWEKSGHGQSQEVHWDSITGQCVSYEYKNAGHFSFSVALPSLPKLALSLSMASLDASFGLSAGTSINVQAAAAMSMKLDLAAGLAIDFERSVGGKILNDETTGGFKFKCVGVAAETKAKVDTEKANMKMLKAMMSITSVDTIIYKGKLCVKKDNMYVDASDMKFF